MLYIHLPLVTGAMIFFPPKPPKPLSAQSLLCPGGGGWIFGEERASSWLINSFKSVRPTILVAFRNLPRPLSPLFNHAPNSYSPTPSFQILRLLQYTGR